MPAQMQSPVDYAVDKTVEEAITCRCKRFPSQPCDNEFTSVDFLCNECRPDCPCGSIAAAMYNCFNAVACRLVPAIGAGYMIHYREDKAHSEDRY